MALTCIFCRGAITDTAPPLPCRKLCFENYKAVKDDPEKAMHIVRAMVAAVNNNEMLPGQVRLAHAYYYLQKMDVFVRLPQLAQHAADIVNGDHTK
jgi:hypothetical protein